MSLPTGSKSITEIDRDYYWYLTGDNVAAGGWNAAKSSFVGKGKPLQNLTQESVDLRDIELINRELPESQKDYVFTSRSDLYIDDNVMTDFMFTENPSTEYEMWVTFIDEGAGYKNSLGYFLYYFDGTNYVILDNSDTNTDNSQGYYRPTVIFPNASSIAGGNLRSDGVLLPGHRRKLKGNLANGKFQNVNVGFFLVPNGWDNKDVSTSIGVRYNNKAILHTYAKFNPNYIEGAFGAANYGYQSVLLNYNAGQQYVVAFEDIQRPGGDGDFNDLILRVETNPIKDIINVARVTEPTLVQSCLQKTKQGLLLVAPSADFTNTGNGDISYRFVRTFDFRDTFQRDRYLEIYTGGYLNWPSGRTPTWSAIGEKGLVVTYPFENSDVISNLVDNYLQLYLFETENNRDDETIVDPSNPDESERTQFGKMVLTQRLENDEVLSESWNLLEVDNGTDPVTETTLKSETNAFPYNTIGSGTIWGDPHIKKVNGEVITLATETGWFTYFESKGLKIEVNFDFYREHPVPIYRNFTFIREAKFTDTTSGESVTINMFSSELPVTESSLSDQSNVLTEVKPDVGSLRSKYLSLLSFDPETKVRVFRWKGALHIWAIFYGIRTDFFNEVYLDGRELGTLLEGASGLLI